MNTMNDLVQQNNIYPQVPSPQVPSTDPSISYPLLLLLILFLLILFPTKNRKDNLNIYKPKIQDKC